MAESNTRQANRAPVTLKIKFKSETLDQFIERYSVDISHGGIFIRTKDPLAVGTSLRFEFQLKDATPLIIGDGTVVWTREHDPKRAGISPGMGVRFDKLPPPSQGVLDKVLARKNGEPEVDDSTRAYDGDDDDDGGFKDSPTRVAPAALVDSLMSHSSNDFDKADPTPLPRPMPFHTDGGDFSDDSFEESTRVASLDSMLAHAESAREDADKEDSVISSSSRPPSQEMKSTRPAPAADDHFGDLSDVDDDGRADTTAGASTDAGEAEDDEEEESDRAETTEHEDEGEDELAARRQPEDEEEEEGLTASNSSTNTKPAKATVLEAPDTDEGGSSMRWIGVAVVILLIGSAGGFWLLSKDDNKVKAEQNQGTQPVTATTDVTNPALAPVVNEDAIKDPIKDPIPPEEPPVETTPVVITTAPPGAMVTIEGTELSAAASPATFNLAAGGSFKVSVTHAGFLSQTMDIVADGSPIALTTLVALPKVLRFTSEPPGATITVNGQRLGEKTPLDYTLGKKLANTPAVRVQMLLRGHKPLNAKFSTSGDFVPEEGKLVKTFTGSMVALPVRVRPVVNKPVVKKPKDPPTNEGDTPPKDPAADPPPVGDPPPKDLIVKDPKVDPKKDPKTDPKKDPKTDPKADPKPDPKPDPSKPGPSEPTPDWMK